MALNVVLDWFLVMMTMMMRMITMMSIMTRMKMVAKAKITRTDVRVFMSLGFQAWMRMSPGILRTGHHAPRQSCSSWP